MAKTYKAKSLKHEPPLEFSIECGDEGIKTFRVPRRQRTDVTTMLAGSVQVNKDGVRTYPNEVIRRALIVMVAGELWEEGTEEYVDPESGETIPAVEGRWVEVSDQTDFIQALNSSRFDIDTQLLGEIVWDLIEELTGHPTGAPRP